MPAQPEEACERSAPAAWVDPREAPSPPATPRPPADDPSEIETLVRLCQRGEIYAVERWIAAGRPIQATRYYVKGRRQFDSPLAVAMESKQHDLALLLLCNGYRPDLEVEEPIGRALRLRSRAMLELLLKWGADPARADVHAVLETNDIELIDRFWNAGLDITADDQLAGYLASPTSKPACGWAKRHKEDPRVARALALALVQVVWNRKARAAHLLVWAGADPHQRVPLLEWKSPGTSDEDDDTHTAVEVAVSQGQGKLLKILKPDPTVDDFATLYADVTDPDAVDFLMRLQPPRDWSPAIRRNVYWIANEFHAERAEEHRWCLERIAHHRGRLTTLEPRDVDGLRREIQRMAHAERQRWLLAWLGNPRFCEPKIFDALVRTPAMQAKLGELGLRTRLQAMRGSRGRAPER